MDNRDGDRGSVRVYCTRGHACWVGALLLAVVVVIVVTLLTRTMPGGAWPLGVVAFCLLLVVVLITIAELNTALLVSDEGLTVRAWPHPDQLLPWDRIVGMRWRHGWWRWLAETMGVQLQPGAHGLVELAVQDEEGRAHWTTIANYVCCGRPPDSVRAVLEEIARRAGLEQIAQRPRTVRPKFEETQWARAET